MKIFSKLFPFLVLALGLVYLAPHFFNSYDSKNDGFDLDGYAALPVQDGGRFKPMDTVARMNLMLVSGKQTFVDENEKRQPAIKWLLDVMTVKDTVLALKEKGGANDWPPVLDYKVFRIDNDQVLTLLGLEPRSATHFRYSYREFSGKVHDLYKQAKRVSEIDEKKRDLFDTKIAELDGHVGIFMALAENKTPRVVIANDGDKDAWNPLAEYLPPDGDVQKLQTLPTAALHYYLLKAYEQNDPKLFNQILAKAKEFIDKDLPRDATTSGFEVFYNRLEPFHYAAEFYVYALVLGILSWLFWTKPLSRAAMLLMVVALGLNGFGLLARMYIQNRPLVMVTNLYSSAIFIGTACAFICLIVECIIPRGIALVAGSAVAAITGIIAHNLSLSGDTMEMMQAVLDTNFWLATHVTCVTLGYTATFFAGFLGLAYVILGVFTTKLRGGGANMLAKMLYGVVCFATLLSFTGTVLGGIWADQSWGRFWGWDPKENGALLIVIWNALILHARWGGLVKQRGMAQLAIGGNIVTSWSWFGTNMLGVGLHSYGFMAGALWWLAVWGFVNFLFISIAWVPQRHWLSFIKPLAHLSSPPQAGLSTSS